MKKYFSLILYCYVITNQSLCMQKNNNDSCTTLGLLAVEYSLFAIHNNNCQIWLNPIKASDNSQNPKLSFFTVGNNPGQSGIQSYTLCSCNIESPGYTPTIASNNNTTIISTDKHFFAYRKNKARVTQHTKNSMLSSLYTTLSKKIATHEHDNLYFIEEEIGLTQFPQNNYFFHSICIHFIDNHDTIRVFNDSDNYQPQSNKTTTLACHPLKKEIAFKRLNNQLTILSSQDQNRYSLYAYDENIVVKLFKSEKEEQISYDLIKYSPDGKFIVFLYPNTLGIYNTETKACSYVQYTIHNYLSMAFCLNTNVLGIINDIGNLTYIDIEQGNETLATQCPSNVKIDNQPLSIHDNLLIFNEPYNIAYAIVGKNLIRYCIPETVARYKKQ